MLKVQRDALIHNGRKCRRETEDEKRKRYTEISLKPIEEASLEEYTEEESYEKILLNASSVLKVWVFDSQDNSELLTDTLNTDFIEISKYNEILPEILIAESKKNVFTEKAFMINDKPIYCLRYDSKYFIRLILISKSRIEPLYHKLIEDTIEDIEENYMNVKKSPNKIREILNQNILLHLSKVYTQLNPEREEILKKIIDDPRELEFIKSEIQRMPEGTFTEFLELYGKMKGEMDDLSEPHGKKDYNVE